MQEIIKISGLGKQLNYNLKDQTNPSIQQIHHATISYQII